MGEAWLEVVDRLLRPARPRLAQCLEERERHRARRARVDAERRQAIADCERRIGDARARVFAANDGIVGGTMTALEREWRLLSRRDPDAGLMDLWAAIAPEAWIDRKRWRDSAPAAQLDAAIALASDPEGVDAAESAVRALAKALAPFGVRIGASIRFRVGTEDADAVSALLDAPLRASPAAVTARARRLEEDVLAATRGRFPDRPLLGRGVARAAFVDAVMGRASPLAPLAALWRTGYAPAAIDAEQVVLEVPPLDQ